MATDFLADLTEQVAAPIQAYLADAGVEGSGVTLAPPTRAGAGDLAMPCHALARVFLFFAFFSS